MPRIGINGKLYYGVAGTAAATEATNVRDVTFDPKRDEVDATTRQHGGWKAYLGGLKDFSIEWESNWDSADAFILACLNSFLGGTAIALKCLDTTAGEGADGDFQIMGLAQSQPNSGVMSVKITAKPHAGSTRLMIWSGGSGLPA
jgi:predicted secreted protein